LNPKNAAMKKYRADKPKQATRAMRAAKRKLEEQVVEKTPKIRKMRQKLKGRIEHSWI
jgi:hypothetical protein